MRNTFEINNEDEDFPEIEGLLSDLEEYNKYFNFGAYLARETMRGISPEDDEISDNNEDQMRKFEELKEKHKVLLDKTGLSLEPIDSPFVMFGTLSKSKRDEINQKMESFVQETGISPDDLDDPDSYEAKRAKSFVDELKEEANSPTRLTEMRLNVSDAEKFLSFLASFEGSNLSPEDKKSLETIAEILKKQFKGQYEVSNPDDDRFLVLIGSLEKIIRQYENIGLGESVKDLTKLLEVSRGKYLNEYLMVDRKSYLLPHDEGFGPARWHMDMNPDTYKNSWESAVAMYKQIKLNPNATELAEQLRTHFIEAIEMAESDILSSPRETKYQIENFPLFLKTLKKSKEELS